MGGAGAALRQLK
uniref:Uncharacterized protein n=1 Tax=Knipowitschia caucasica TaxID=637954 RepID=A0AAV2K7M7_KNICA